MVDDQIIFKKFPFVFKAFLTVVIPYFSTGLSVELGVSWSTFQCSPPRHTAFPHFQIHKQRVLCPPLLVKNANNTWNVHNHQNQFSALPLRSTAGNDLIDKFI
uniref:Uncharacterized protein n=1 Tax=Helicotheca tamesis TaxID=374047 RepID=A0A7S2HM79_9STRA